MKKDMALGVITRRISLLTYTTMADLDGMVMDGIIHGTEAIGAIPITGTVRTGTLALARAILSTAIMDGGTPFTMVAITADTIIRITVMEATTILLITAVGEI